MFIICGSIKDSFIIAIIMIIFTAKRTEWASSTSRSSWSCSWRCLHGRLSDWLTGVARGDNESNKKIPGRDRQLRRLLLEAFHAAPLYRVSTSSSSTPRQVKTFEFVSNSLTSMKRRIISWEFYRILISMAMTRDFFFRNSCIQRFYSWESLVRSVNGS